MVELELVKAESLISEKEAEIKQHEHQAERHKKRIEEI